MIIPHRVLPIHFGMVAPDVQTTSSDSRIACGHTKYRLSHVVRVSLKSHPTAGAVLLLLECGQPVAFLKFREDWQRTARLYQVYASVLETLAAIIIIGLPNTQTNMIIARCMEAVTQF